MSTSCLGIMLCLFGQKDYRMKQENCICKVDTLVAAMSQKLFIKKEFYTIECKQNCCYIHYEKSDTKDLFE